MTGSLRRMLALALLGCAALTVGCKKATPQPEGTVEGPTFAPAEGDYGATLHLSLASATEGASIRYTIDGSAPTATYGREYDGAPFDVVPTTTVRAIAFLDGWTDSPVVGATYTLAAGTVEAPVLDPAGGGFVAFPVAVTMSAATEGATIRYTMDGSTPTAKYGTPYAGVPVSVASAATVKAIAYLEGWADSPVASASFTLAEGTVEAPVLSPAGGTFGTAPVTVKMSTATEGATIRYTVDGTTPSARYGTPYAGAPVSLGSTTTVKAVAYLEGWADSPVVTAVFTLAEGAVAAPVLSPAGGTFGTAPVTVTMSTTTAKAKIRYTIDGSTPSAEYGTLYAGAPLSVGSTTTVKAIAYLEGPVESSVVTAVFTLVEGAVAAPVLSPAGGTFGTVVTVTMSTTTVKAKIRYTIDGSTPSAEYGTLYAGAPLSVGGTTTVKAIAYLKGPVESSVVTAVFTLVEGTVAAPVLSPAGGTFGTAPVVVTISTATERAGIRYTIDGSTPSAEYGTLYAGAPLSVGSTTTVKAIAFLEGSVESSMVTAVYTLSISVPEAAAPIMTPAGGAFGTSPVSVTMSTATAGAEIHYTIDGSTPTAEYGTPYAGVPLSLVSTATVKAVASRAGYSTSGVSSGEFELSGTVATPTLDPGGGLYTATQYVILSTATAGARIRYTLDDTEPDDVYGSLYAGTPVTVAVSRTLKAIAYIEDVGSSMVASADYTIQVAASAPYFTPAAGTYPDAQAVTIASLTDGAGIRYTTDGSMPTSSSGTLYTEPIEVTRNSTVRAIAYADGMRDSTVTTAAYVIAGTVTTPTFLPTAGTYAAAQTVTISTTTDGATVVYTTDGSVPSRTNGTVYTEPVLVDATVTVRTFAYKTGWTDSVAATAAYSIAVDSTGTVGQWTSIVASGDDVYVAYYDATNLDLKVAGSADSGENWSIVKADYPGSVGQYASLAADGADLYVAYCDATNGDLRFARSSDGGAHWTRTLVESANNVGQYTSIAVSGSSVIISYYDVTNGDLRLATSTDGGAAWSSQTLDSTGTTGLWTSLVADGGNLYLTYYSSTAGALRFLRYFSAAWSTPTSWDTGSVGQYGSLRFDPSSTTLYAAYYDATSVQLKLAVSTSSDGGDTWPAPTISVIDTDGYVGQWANLALANGDDLTVSYYEDYDYNLKVARSLNGGVSWSTVVVDTDGVGQYSSVADTGGMIAVSYYDLVNLDLKVATSSDGALSWVRY